MKKKGFTLIELIIAVSILVILFIALYDLYMKNYRLYKNDQQKVKAQIEVKNFSDTLYNYLKASYQNSIEVGNRDKLNNVDKGGFEENMDTLFMVIPENGDPAEYVLDNYWEKVSENPNKYLPRGMLNKLLGTAYSEDINHFHGNNCTPVNQCTRGNKYYHYIMFNMKSDKGENYIETISNISGGDPDGDIKSNYNNMPGSRTEALNGIIDNLTIKPEYVGVLDGVVKKEVISKLTITLDYSYGKGKTDKMTIDYTIRN